MFSQVLRCQPLAICHNPKPSLIKNILNSLDTHWCVMIRCWHFRGTLDILDLCFSIILLCLHIYVAIITFRQTFIHRKVNAFYRIQNASCHATNNCLMIQPFWQRNSFPQAAWHINPTLREKWDTADKLCHIVILRHIRVLPRILH